ncbi:hypothetical protein BC937DRAFT_95647 [Endogone sp. FLAS-F59071]|nr:hypothetical protein BC937DRAFT_95647 [Endogone sp. FLAS-F59071]|eukprot:RUS22873.1 hypothetical protein BC937DRAFT_95647 [Endogone sp. FLAS-F59071]
MEAEKQPCTWVTFKQATRRSVIAGYYNNAHRLNRGRKYNHPDMWFLVGFGQTQGVKRWLQPGKTYTIGRVLCDIAFKDDKTLSRKHAEITIAEATWEIAVNFNARMAVTLRDTRSLCGTTVNGEKLKEEPKVLQEGDKIVFAQNTYLTLVWEPIVICCSGMPGPHKTALFNRILRFGMSTIGGKAWRPSENFFKHIRTLSSQLDLLHHLDWLPDICTHLIMFRLRIAPKVIQALVECRDIVSDKWIVDFESLVPDLEKKWALPDTRSTLPPIAVEGLDPLDVSFFPNERRRSMFEGKKFVIFSREQYSVIAPMIKHAKGRVEICVPGEEIENSSHAIASFVKGHADMLMVRPSELDDEQESGSEKWAEVIAATHSLNTRLIREQEIALAILYISTSTFCNPSVPCPPEPFVISLTPHNSLAPASIAALALSTTGPGSGVGFKPKKRGIDIFWDDALADSEVLPPPTDETSKPNIPAEWDDELDIRPPLVSVARRAELNHKAEITAIAAIAAISAKRVAEVEVEGEDSQSTSENGGFSRKKRRIGSKAASPEPVHVFSSQVTGLAQRDWKETRSESAKEKTPALEYIESAISRKANELGSARKDDMNMQRNLAKVEITNLVVRRESPVQQNGRGVKIEGDDRARRNFKRFQKTQHAGMGGREISIIKMVPHEGGNLGAGADENWLDSKDESSVSAKAKKTLDQSSEKEESVPMPTPKASKGKGETSRTKRRSIPIIDVVDDDDDDGFTEFAAKLKKAKMARAGTKDV